MSSTAALNTRSDVPVVFLDLDGVVNSYPPPKPHHVKAYGTYENAHVACDDGNTYWLWWSPRVVEFLNSLHRSGRAEVVFLTTWLEEAVSRFAPTVGLDPFPVVTDYSGGERAWETDWWKFQRVCDFLGENETARRVVWLDDDLSRQVKTAFRTKYDPDKTRSLLLTVQPCPGLWPGDMEAIEAFLSEE